MGRPPVNNIPSEDNGGGLKKGPWSPEEDQKLLAYIRRCRIWNWSQMSKPAGLASSGKSCRLRWMNYLRPNIRHGNFSKEEEETIIRWHQELGNRWSTIAKKIPGRTDNEIKNYWNTHLKKRVGAGTPILSVPKSSEPPSSDVKLTELGCPIIYESGLPQQPMPDSSSTSTITSERTASDVESESGSSSSVDDDGGSLLRDTGETPGSFWEELCLPDLEDISMRTEEDMINYISRALSS